MVERLRSLNLSFDDPDKLPTKLARVVNGQTVLDEIYYSHRGNFQIDWRTPFLEQTKAFEKAAQTKTLGTFKQVFVDSWRKASIIKLVRKLDLAFIVEVNNETKFFIPSSKLQFNADSVSFDLDFPANVKKHCPALERIHTVTIVAALKKYKLLRRII